MLAVLSLCFVVAAALACPMCGPCAGGGPPPAGPCPGPCPGHGGPPPPPGPGPCPCHHGGPPMPGPMPCPGHLPGLPGPLPGGPLPSIVPLQWKVRTFESQLATKAFQGAWYVQMASPAYMNGPNPLKTGIFSNTYPASCLRMIFKDTTPCHEFDFNTDYYLVDSAFNLATQLIESTVTLFKAAYGPGSPYAIFNVGTPMYYDSPLMDKNPLVDSSLITHPIEGPYKRQYTVACIGGDDVWDEYMVFAVLNQYDNLFSGNEDRLLWVLTRSPNPSWATYKKAFDDIIASGLNPHYLMSIDQSIDLSTISTVTPDDISGDSVIRSLTTTSSSTTTVDGSTVSSSTTTTTTSTVAFVPNPAFTIPYEFGPYDLFGGFPILKGLSGTDLRSIVSGKYYLNSATPFMQDVVGGKPGLLNTAFPSGNIQTLFDDRVTTPWDYTSPCYMVDRGYDMLTGDLYKTFNVLYSPYDGSVPWGVFTVYSQGYYPNPLEELEPLTMNGMICKAPSDLYTTQYTLGVAGYSPNRYTLFYLANKFKNPFYPSSPQNMFYVMTRDRIISADIVSDINQELLRCGYSPKYLTHIDQTIDITDVYTFLDTDFQITTTSTTISSSGSTVSSTTSRSLTTGSGPLSPGDLPLGPGGLPLGPDGLPLGPGGLPLGPGGLPLGPGGPHIPGVPGLGDGPHIPGVPGLGDGPHIPGVPGPCGGPHIPGVPGPGDGPHIPGVPGPCGGPHIPGVPGPGDGPHIPGVPGPCGGPHIPGVPGPDGGPHIPGVPSPCGGPHIPGPHVGPKDLGPLGPGGLGPLGPGGLGPLGPGGLGPLGPHTGYPSIIPTGWNLRSFETKYATNFMTGIWHLQMATPTYMKDAISTRAGLFSNVYPASNMRLIFSEPCTTYDYKTSYVMVDSTFNLNTQTIESTQTLIKSAYGPDVPYGVFSVATPKYYESTVVEKNPFTDSLLVHHTLEGIYEREYIIACIGGDDIWSDYLVFAVLNQYDNMYLGNEEHLIWVMTRSKTPDWSTYQKAFEDIRNSGLNPNYLINIDQSIDLKSISTVTDDDYNGVITTTTTTSSSSTTIDGTTTSSSSTTTTTSSLHFTLGPDYHIPFDYDTYPLCGDIKILKNLAPEILREALSGQYYVNSATPITNDYDDSSRVGLLNTAFPAASLQVWYDTSVTTPWDYSAPCMMMDRGYNMINGQISYTKSVVTSPYNDGKYPWGSLMVYTQGYYSNPLSELSPLALDDLACTSPAALYTEHYLSCIAGYKKDKYLITYIANKFNNPFYTGDYMNQLYVMTRDRILSPEDIAEINQELCRIGYNPSYLINIDQTMEITDSYEFSMTEYEITTVSTSSSMSSSSSSVSISSSSSSSSSSTVMCDCD